MPNRIIRDGINSSPRVNRLSMGAEVLYRRLMTVVDDYGRYHGSAVTIRAACWPTCPDKVTDLEVATWLGECTEGDRPLIRFYEVHGAKYLEICEFGQQQRSRSKFPEPTTYGPGPDPKRNGNQSSDNPISTRQQNSSTSRSRISKSKSETESQQHAEAPDEAALPPPETEAAAAASSHEDTSALGTVLQTIFGPTTGEPEAQRVRAAFPGASDDQIIDFLRDQYRAERATIKRDPGWKHVGLITHHLAGKFGNWLAVKRELAAAAEAAAASAQRNVCPKCADTGFLGVLLWGTLADARAELARGAKTCDCSMGNLIREDASDQRRPPERARDAPPPRLALVSGGRR